MTLLSQPFDPFVSSEESHELAVYLAPEIKVALGLKRFATNQYAYHLERIILNLYLAQSSNPDKCVGISRQKITTMVIRFVIKMSRCRLTTWSTR